MMKGFKNIRYYILCMVAAFGVYTWAAFSGTRIFGDDNGNKDGRTMNATGVGHIGGHGFYFHK